ncbi:hypothetical protein ACWEQG_01515 [Microbispora sp. NPDC004025]
MKHRLMMWLCLALVPATVGFNLAEGMPWLAVVHTAVALMAAGTCYGLAKNDRLLTENAEQLAENTRQLAENDQQLTELAVANFRHMPLHELVARHDDSAVGRQPLYPPVMAAACAVLRERMTDCGCEGDPS